MAKRAAARRGQALVETALGTMVFVTILVFGIYFAEVGALTLKVQEAANFALWEATGHVQHDPREGEFQRRGAVAQAEAEANRRYRDFDGRSSQGGGAMTVQLAIARAGLLGWCVSRGCPEGSAHRGHPALGRERGLDRAGAGDDHSIAGHVVHGVLRAAGRAHRPLPGAGVLQGVPASRQRALHGVRRGAGLGRHLRREILGAAG
ncbi:hypothetical protein ACN28S_57375 [Cystobacter fuscus]